MTQERDYLWRFYVVALLLGLGCLGLVWRIIDLGVVKHVFLQKQSDVRSIRVINTHASRGMILDRNGEPLAVSIPVQSVWINPQIFAATPRQIAGLAGLLNVPSDRLDNKIRENSKRYFIYLKRRIPPETADKIRDLNISGLFFQQEYRRYYPEAEVASHVLGFTNIDDQGQEGLELAYNSWLKGTPGKQRVLKDRIGHIIAVMDNIVKPQQGHNLTLSIDRRIQYLAYRELKQAVVKYNADSGSVVVLDVKTGEVLAMVNQPAYNPNKPPKIHDGRYRNRAVTDVFEPGSTMKTFSVVNALKSGKYTPNTKVNTNPGWFIVDGHTVKDEGINHGILTVTGVLQKSSNIGIAKITLSLPPDSLWQTFHDFGFGEITASSFPGEVPGTLVDRTKWKKFALATLSFGYGVAVTPLQLASGYAIIADDGVKIPVTFLKLAKPPVGKRVVSAKIAKEVIQMLETVSELGGTGTRAQIPGYTVAGKTGTAYIADAKGYNKDKYIADYVGIAPATKPRFVVVVVIRDPHGQHYAGVVAAPVFAHVMGGALRMMGVAPDKTTKK